MKSQRGQALVLAVLSLGIIMAGVVIYGNVRGRDAAVASARVEQGQAAYEALASAAKRVQSMYANEAGCVPEVLDTRLSNLPNLPSTPTSLTFAGNNVVYIVAQPSLTSPDRENRCTSGAATAGCRQFAIPIDAFAYIVTAGVVSRDATDATRGGLDCPRDASIFLSTVANGNVYMQRVTLTNICSFQACGGGMGFDTATSSSPISLTNGGGNVTTLACTGNYAGISARHIGGGFTESTTTSLSLDDLRWARRYLETGGEDVGETNFLYTGSALPAAAGNGACMVQGGDLSAGQCHDKPCFPFFDLNRDYKNNEEDLAILENFMRGYLTTIPVNDGMQ